MPSSANTSMVEKLHHAKMITRFLYHRGAVDAIWDTAEDKYVFETFIHHCVQDAQIDFQTLMMIHDHELLKLFDDFGMSAKDRCVVRKYLDLPEDAIWVLWTAAKAGLFFAVSAFNISKKIFGAPGVLLIAATAAFGFAGRSLRYQIVEEVKRVMAERGGGGGGGGGGHQHAHQTAAVAAGGDATRGSPSPQEPPGGLALKRQHNHHPQQQFVDRSNPFYDDPQPTPRYPAPRFAQYDFRSSRSPPAAVRDEGQYQRHLAEDGGVTESMEGTTAAGGFVFREDSTTALY